MKIAFDVHGTIKENPEIFKPLMVMLIKSGVQVYIISGPPNYQIRDELTELGYKENKHYSKIESVVDFLIFKTQTKMTQDENDNWWCDERIWWSAKGSICYAYNVDIIIDNELKYKKAMPPKTIFVHWQQKYTEVNKVDKKEIIIKYVKQRTGSNSPRWSSMDLY